MESLEEENMIKDIKKNFIIKKYIRRLRQEKETNAIKARILRDIKILFEHEKEEENYCKPVRVSNFCRNNFVEYESNGDRNKTLSVEGYLNTIFKRHHKQSQKIWHMEKSINNSKQLYFFIR